MSLGALEGIEEAIGPDVDRNELRKFYSGVLISQEVLDKG
jgi:hypothetical protein